MSIDKALYSRQIYAVGAETQKKYSEADILLIGLSGLGVEIAKNLMLTGIRSLTLIDNNKISFLDLSTNFYATEEDVGRNRCDVLHPKIQELNSYVQVDSFDGEISELFVKKYHCIVIVDIGFSTELARNVDEWARSNNSKFISCETIGLTANIFTDFGDEFCITDSNGVDFPICLVTSISHDGLVVCHDDKSHQLQNGDYIVFSQLPDHCGLPNGIEFRVRNVQTPYNFFLEIPSEYKIENIPYLNAYVRGIKKSQYQSFESLEKSMKAPSFTISDFGKIEASMELHVFFQALHDFKIRNNKLPGAGEMGDAKEIISLMQKISPDMSFNEELYTNFAKMSSGSFVGLTAFIGGLAAHEVLKAISGKYTPIHQWYNFDVRECILPDVKDCERAPCNSRYDGQRVIFGDSCIKEFLRQKYFIVGAGALGCELMKNFALAGIGCSKEGSVTITDMDMIEKSNLSRQFLFRSNDIGKLKSECAAKAAQNMNRDLNVVAMQDKVAEETCEVFNDAFWENLTGVCTALDNISARLFVDAQCVKYRKPMVDSGTLGSKANAQVVIPQLTESYSSSRDPPEKSVPVCTLKNFPTAIEHTIQWARDAFEGLFSGQINDVVQFLSNEKFIESLAESEPAQLPHTINNIVTSLKNIPSSFSDCVAFARLQFEESFKNIILQLLYNFPLDSVTTSGAPFWTGPKKPPTPIEFSAQDDTHFEYIRSCAVLRANNFSIHFTEQDLSRENIIRVLDKVVVPPFQARKVKISTDENAKTEEQDASNLTYTMKDLPQRSQFIFLLDKLKLCSFEKDDDGNSHVAFITSCSNLRATNYKIPTADFDQTKKIAGSIIPAMVTTTALITGLVMIEVAKLITIPKNSWSLELFRNSFVSLEIALTAFSDPIAPSLNYYGPASDPRKNSWTMWDTIDVDIGRDVTLKEFIDYLYDTYSFEISMMSCGQGLIYSFFGNSSKNRLPLPVSEAVESVTKSKLSINQKYLYFEVVCSIEDVDVDIPTIKYRFRY